MNEFDHFLDLVQGKEKEPKVNCHDCVQALKLTQDAQHSREKQLETSQIPDISPTKFHHLKGPLNFVVCGIGRMGAFVPRRLKRIQMLIFCMHMMWIMKD